jgi:hypothetical protein
MQPSTLKFSVIFILAIFAFNILISIRVFLMFVKHASIKVIVNVAFFKDG